MELTEYLKKIKGSEGYRIFLTGLNKQFKSAGGCIVSLRFWRE